MFHTMVPQLPSIGTESLEKDGVRDAGIICPLRGSPRHSISKYLLSLSVRAAAIAARADSKQPGRVLRLLSAAI